MKVWTLSLRGFKRNHSQLLIATGFCKILATGLNRHCKDFHIWKSTADYNILGTGFCRVLVTGLSRHSNDFHIWKSTADFYLLLLLLLYMCRYLYFELKDVLEP